MSNAAQSDIADARRAIIIVDHAFHQRTLSSKFLTDLLQGPQTKLFFVDPEKPELLSLLKPHRSSHALVFVQLRPDPQLLRALGHRNVTWVPMHDDLRVDSKRVRQLEGSNIKFINFCREAHEVFVGRSQPSLAVRYWPEPPPAPERTAREHPRIFLWDRGQVQWPLLKRLLGEQPIDSVVLRLAPDPKHRAERPSVQDIRRYRIEVVEGWLEHDAYLSLLHSCDVFVAPRWLEGIGMAMLHAMASGQAVLAPDRPTMNEYVRHGRNGWLFDPEQPEPVDLSGWQAMGRQAREDCMTGAAEWNRQKELILPFVMARSPRRERLGWKLRAWAGR